jgi:predicted HAD superfamily hydrolase
MDIETLLNNCDNTLKILSLDCFDTLLWRKVAEPSDVFYDLQHYPTFSALGITARQRMTAERQARSYNYLQQENNEVTLHEIYRTGFPSLTEKQIQALMEEEIAAESETCYPFLPIVNLMRNAISRNVKIIIVSSTYLTEKQLRQLLMNVLPTDAYAAIRHVFCSGDFKLSKQQGLFKKILTVLAISPQEIFHFGDNINADFLAPKAENINAAYITPLDNKIKNILWLQSVAALHTQPDIRHTCSMPSPYKAVLFNARIDTSKPEQLIGYVSLGPVMYAFARFITDKITALQQMGKKTKIAFLMRDAYLPALATEILDNNLNIKRLHISRFVANAASLRTRQNVLSYLAENFHTWTLEETFKQLLIPEEEIVKVIEEIRNAPNSAHAFTEFVLQKPILDIIFKKSKQYFLRLNRYFQNNLNLQKNDTLVLVDIGYKGTIQRLLTPILEKANPGLQVTGLYFQLEDCPEWQFSRQGLFDSAFTDNRNFQLALTSFALIEEFFSDGGDSVGDYTENGSPLSTPTRVSTAQANKIKLIQAECLRFIRDTQSFLKMTEIDIPFKMQRQTALAALFRIMFFLTAEEINFIADFTHNVNKDNTQAHAIFGDTDKHLQSLRRNSLWFSSNSSYSLREVADFEQTLTLISKKRLLDFFPADGYFSVRYHNIPIYLSYGDKKEERQAAAHPTYDGYFSAAILLTQPGVVQVEILFGNCFEWVQLESVEAVNHEHAFHEHQIDFTQDISTFVQFNQMEKSGKNLFQCFSAASSASIKIEIHGNTIMKFAFRPISMR